MTNKMKRSRIILAAAAAGAAALIAADAASAATTTGTVLVNSTVVASCSVSTNPLPFGNYTGAVNNASANVGVTCSNTTTYNVGIDAGLGTGATTTVRKMANGGQFLNYALYSDSGRTTNWGNVVGTDTVAGTGNGTQQTLTIYGQIPAGQAPTPNTYQDTVTVTVTY